MDNFGDSVAQALPDVGNGPTANGTGPPKNEEAHAAARKAGWVEPTAFDYTAADTRGPPPTEAVTGDEDLPSWAHNAKRYEYTGEEGDIGPKVPELEEQLFRSDFQNRKGVKFDTLCSIKVVAEASEKPSPIIDVRLNS